MDREWSGRARCRSASAVPSPARSPHGAERNAGRSCRVAQIPGFRFRSIRATRLRGSLASFPIHNVKQRSFFVPARVVAPGFCFSLSIRPRTRGRGAPEARTSSSPVTLARRDAARCLTRPSRATGTAPLGAPPWRFSGRATNAACGRQCSRRHATPSRGRALAPAGRVPRPPAPAVRAATARDCHHPAPSQNVSGDAPHERGYESCVA